MTDILVRIVSAANLAAGDDNGLSDPYVVLVAGKAKKKTKTIKKTLNPEWHASFIVDMGDLESFDFHIFDWDAVGKDDFLGYVSIPLHGLKVDNEVREYQVLPRDSIATDYEITGTLSVSFADPPAGGTVQKLASSAIDDIKSRIKQNLTGKEPTLDLSAVGLSKIPNAVCATCTPHLTGLDLGFNAFVAWPTELNHLFASLQTLDLSGNRLKLIPSQIHDLVSLQELHLNGNQIVTISPEIGACRKLEKLNLANNRVAALPAEIGRLTALEELNLAGNALTTIPEDIGECEMMEVVDLSCCMLESLPEQFTYMTRLLELNLGNNKLMVLPETIGRMTRLVVLQLSDNQLSDLPLSMGMCAGLGNLGAGINIDRNPMTNEALVAKAAIGTDHLAAFLADRYSSVGSPALPDFPRSTINAGDADAAAAPTTLADRTAAAAAAARVSQGTMAAPSPVKTPRTQLAEKLRALVNWGSATIQDEFKPTLAGMKFGISRCEDVQESLGFANSVKALRPHLDEVRGALGATVSAAPAPELLPTDEKLVKLQKTLDASVSDALICVNALQRELLAADDQAKVIQLVTLVKKFKATLDSFEDI
jgi:hypothetical protein